MRAVPPGGRGESLPGRGVHGAVGLHAADAPQAVRDGRQLGLRLAPARLALRQGRLQGAAPALAAA